MTSRVYNTAGSYNDNTDSQIYVGASQVNLTSNVASGDVVVNSVNDDVYVIGDSQNVYSAAHSAASGSTVELGGNFETYYGSSSSDLVDLVGQDDLAYGASSNGNYFLLGDEDLFSGNSGNDMVHVEGTNGVAVGGYGNDTFSVFLPTASTNTIDGGGGTNTLSLTDQASDASAITFDLAKNTDTGLGGLTFSSFQNIDYSVQAPGDSSRRSASTQFTLESGTNNLDFSYSSGTNTVFSAGTGNTTVQGGSGTDIVVGGTGSTRLGTDGGTDYLYGGMGTNVIQASNGTGGNDRFFAGSGTDYDFSGGSTGNEYMYSTTGTDYFQGGGGTNVIVEGTSGSDEFHGTVGTDYIYGASAASKVYGGSGTDFVYTGTQAQYFDSGSGKEYFEEMQGTQSNGKMDVVDNFQTAANGKGTFVFLPSYEASATSFVQSQGGVAIETNIGGSQMSTILVANTTNIAAVKAQTSFSL